MLSTSRKRAVFAWLAARFGPPPPPPRRYFSKSWDHDAHYRAAADRGSARRQGERSRAQR